MNKQDKQIFAFIEAQSFKQAIQLAKKLTTQYPSSTYFKILLQYVKFKQSPKKFDYETGLHSFLTNESLPSDLKSLRLLSRFFIESGLSNQSMLPYEKCMVKYPSFEICYEWFNKSIEFLDFKNLYRSTFQLPRLSSDPRNLKFWNGLSIVLWFKCQPKTMSVQEKNLLPELGFKTINQLKPFISDQERIVFCHVCELFDNKSKDIVDEILSFWDPKQYLDLYLKEFLIRHLKKLNLYGQLYDACRNLLFHLDDFSLIKELIHAGFKLNKPKKELIQDMSLRDSRNYRLSRIELDYVFHNKEISDQSLDWYLEAYHNKTCCISDLSSYEIDKTKILTSFDKFPNDLTHDCNRCKITKTNDVNVFSDLFVKYNLSLKVKPKTDYTDCSYLILKIIETLINDNNLSITNLIIAISLLENYQAEDPFNFDTRIWLVILYMYMGLPKIAFQHYKELKIKNIQNDILDHLLYSRFSTILPNKTCEYLKEIDEQENIYKSLEKIPQLIRIAFERKSFSKIIGMFVLYKKLQNSLMRWLKILEKFQMAHLFNNKRRESLKQINIFLENSINFDDWEDNRDYQILGSLKDTCKKVQSYMNFNSSWITMTCCRELMYENVISTASDLFIKSHIATIDLTYSTDVEKWSWEISKNIYSQSDDTVNETIITLLNEDLEIPPNTWELHHSYLTQLIILKRLDNLKKIKDPVIKSLIKSRLILLKKRIQLVFEDYLKQISMATSETQSNKLLTRFGYRSVSNGIIENVKETVKFISSL